MTTPGAPDGPRGAQPLQIDAPLPGTMRTPPAQHQNLTALAVRQTHKRIVICADGTWNRAQPENIGKSDATNVWLMYQLVKDHAADGTPQLAFYHAGVGTGNFLDRVAGGLFGVGLGANIRQIYRFLVDHYHPGDYVYLFGFSRGAYTVRSLAGMIRNCGIVDPSKLPAGASVDDAVNEAFTLYRKRADATAPRAQAAVDFRVKNSHPDFRITCIGVWDTVGSLGIPVGLLGHLTAYLVGFHDVTLSSWIDCALHAVAVDERRRPFVPTLWLQQPGAREMGQRLEQRWFSGVHSDVGGGYKWPDRGLATLTLRWMVQRVSAMCRLELDTAPLDTAPKNEIALHDSLTPWYRCWAPVYRTIDGGLGHDGARDDSRLTDEAMDRSVNKWREKFHSTPMPVVRKPYAPPNVADYEERVTQAQHTPPVQPPDYPPDLRATPLSRISQSP